ncbi:golgin subfamily A member 4 isoform X2 [Protopterus annectens]|uniref:golgin subfamily A member 4 isoform X2 n=1 Tax=Protopterus annectens TaxID=7888 RepID=UPI001CF969CF|nr:golgin subfamily A member 4 isoform X2 [Protopterus annectens]
MEELLKQIEAEKNNFGMEITAMAESHKEDLEKICSEQKNMWSEKLQLLKEQHQYEIEQLTEKHQLEQEALLNEKETNFRAHIEDMNQKTLEKLDVKQSELEALAAELCEALKLQSDLEFQLAKVRDEADVKEKEYEEKVEQQKRQNTEEMIAIRKEIEQSVKVVEKEFKNELDKIKLLLDEKDTLLDELRTQEQFLREALIKAQNECKESSATVKCVCHSHQKDGEEIQEPNNTRVEDQLKQLEKQLAEVCHKLSNAESEKEQQVEKVALASMQVKDLTAEVKLHKSELQTLRQELEEQRQKEVSLTECYESQLKNCDTEISHLKVNATEKENIVAKLTEMQILQKEEYMHKHSAVEQRLKTLQTDYDEKIKAQEGKVEHIRQKTKEMQDRYKKKLNEKEAKHKEELNQMQIEFTQKETEFMTKMLQMSGVTSAEDSDALSSVELTLKQEIESLTVAHRQEVDQLNSISEQLQEKHKSELNMKVLEVSDVKQQLVSCNVEKEYAYNIINDLRGEYVKKEVALQKLQAEASQSSAEVKTLLQRETCLNAETELLERKLSMLEKEKTSYQDQLSELRTAKEQYQNRAEELSRMLTAVEERLKTSEFLRNEEKDFYNKTLHEKNLEAEQKEISFKNQLNKCSQQLTLSCKETESLLYQKTTDLYEEFCEKLIRLCDRIAQCQNHIVKIKDVMLLKITETSEQEEHIKRLTKEYINQVTEDCNYLNICVDHLTQKVQDKEKCIADAQYKLYAFETEKESLHLEQSNHQQTAADNETCFRHLGNDLAENRTANTTTKAKVLERQSEIVCLNEQVKELCAQLSNNLSLDAKQSGISQLQHLQEKEKQILLDQIQQFISNLTVLSQEKRLAVEQVEHEKSKLLDLKNKMDAEFLSNNSTVEVLQSKFNSVLLEKDSHLAKMKEELMKQNSVLEHLKVELEQERMQKAKLVCDLAADLELSQERVSDLEKQLVEKSKDIVQLTKELEQQIQQKNTECQEFVFQLQQAQFDISENGNRLQGAREETELLHKKVEDLKVALKAKQDEFEELRRDLIRDQKDALKAAEEKIMTESTGKISELKKKAEHRIIVIKKQFTSQLDDKENLNKNLMNQVEELRRALHEKEMMINSLTEKIKSIEMSLLNTKQMDRLVEEKLVKSREKDLSLLDIQNYTEQVNALQNNISVEETLSQSDKDAHLETKVPAAELEKSNRELVINVQQAEQEKEHLQGEDDRVFEQNKGNSTLMEQHKDKDGRLTSLHEEINEKHQKIFDLENVVLGLQAKLAEQQSEKHCLECKLKEAEDSFAREMSELKDNFDNLSKHYEERLKELLNNLEEKSAVANKFEKGLNEDMNSDTELKGLICKMQVEQKELHAQAERAECDKQKLQQDVNRLQKEIHALRKEHLEELETVKKEVTEEQENRLKFEQEDIEMKHNSILKQLMREFNTQMSQKEHELETSIRETINKAQEVEAELLESHQEERTQLLKKIAQKEDDLNRTVKRYEDILQTREDEMTAKVTELQAQLEQLQGELEHTLTDDKNLNNQALLAEKTSLLNEAKLKEQEFREQIHMLEDQLKDFQRNYCVAPLGAHRHDYGKSHNYSTKVSRRPDTEDFRARRIPSFILAVICSDVLK